MTEVGTSGVMSAVLAESTTPRPSRPPRRYVTSAVSRSIESSFLAATAPSTATRSWAAMRTGEVAYGQDHSRPDGVHSGRTRSTGHLWQRQPVHRVLRAGAHGRNR